MGMTYEEFVATATEKFNGRYTYLRQGEYRHKERTIVYTCTEHGEVTQKFSQHLKLGCGKCGVKATNLAKRWGLEDWVAKIGDKFDHRYTYTSVDKVGATTYINYICPEHGEIRQAFKTHIESTHGCPKCSAIKATLPQRKQVDWDERGRQLLGDSFIGVEAGKPPKFIYRCKRHGIKKSNAQNMLRGSGCQECGDARMAANRTTQLTDELMLELKNTHKGKYEYVGSEVKQGRTYIKYTCTLHGSITQLLTTHRVGHGCKRCGVETVKNGLMHSLHTFIDNANSVHGNIYVYIGLSLTKIEDRTVKLVHYLCSRHGLQTQRAGSHLFGHGCPECSRGVLGESKRTTEEEYIQLASVAHSNKYTYKNVTYQKLQPTLITAVCPTHGEFTQRVSDHIYKKAGCPKCFGRVSAASTEIFTYLESLGVLPQQEVRLGSSKFFWDIVIPEKRIAIEFHGLYWHSSEYRANNYHKIKHDEGLQAGYRTIHIFEDEWANRKEQVKALLASAVGLSAACGSIYARSCTISSVVASEAREFLEQHHVQGFRPGSNYIGLYSQGALVAVLGCEFRKSGRGQTTTLESMEITRYATSTHVVGGMSKLMSHLVKITPELKEVYSFSDIRMYSGNLYAACGFTQAYSTAPDYSYVVNGNRIHKSSYQKSRFKSDPNLQYADGLTEVELAELNNLYRIYDCGKVKWVKKVR